MTEGNEAGVLDTLAERCERLERALQLMPDEVATILPRLGNAQRRVIVSLTKDWGEAACHKTAKRMFYGVAGQHRPVVFHKHRTDNCWCLSALGMALKSAIAMEAASAGETECNNG